MSKQNAVPPVMYDIVFNRPEGVDAVPVTSVVFGENGRPISYGYRANGDTFQVAIDDILAKPQVFLAPCGRPFHITGRVVVDPCNEAPDEPDTLESADMTLAELGGVIPGLGELAPQLATALGSEAAAEKLILSGVRSMSDLAEMEPGKLRELVGAGPANTYRKTVEGPKAATRKGKTAKNEKSG